MNGTITKPPTPIPATVLPPIQNVYSKCDPDILPRFVIGFRRVWYSAFSDQIYIQAALLDRLYDRVVFRSGEYGSVSAATDAVLAFTRVYCPDSDVATAATCPVRPIRLG